MSTKTHKGLAKRLKVTATGKILHRPAGKRHSMSKKPAKRVRRLNRWTELHKGQVRNLKRQHGGLT
ncbi:MAG: 50S ribosomal protein L35 [Candidatus Brocadiae bacterium]|nr:50S ribosomal protein L35 [Candidatus Brocadiia bacterium]